MRHLYSLLLYLLTPALLLYFLFRGISDRGWWRRWPERFGFTDAGAVRGGIVVHAVSVGEVNAAAPLIRASQQRWPDLPITVTCFTPTGSRRVVAAFGDSVHHAYAPIDLPGAVRRFLRALEPRLLLVMETEIWPNLFGRAHACGSPIVIANARLTEHSSRGWARFRGLARRALRCVRLIAAQSDADARRFVGLGADPDRVRSVGNLKFDLPLPDDLDDRAAALRAQWGPGRTVLVAGSTHEGDETPLLEAFSLLLDRQPGALLVLAPRYPERFDRVAERAAGAGFSTRKLSEGQGADESTECLVVDRMGDLLNFYAAADIAFIGGTLAAVGGHNPLEAAALGKPILLGPHTAHIEGLATELLDANAAIGVDGAGSLKEAWALLAGDSNLREEMGRAGRRLVEREQGALTRTLQIIDKLLLE